MAIATGDVNGIPDKRSDSSSPTSKSNTFHSGFSLNLFAITLPPDERGNIFNGPKIHESIQFDDLPEPDPITIKSYDCLNLTVSGIGS